jgi:RIO kinase 1
MSAPPHLIVDPEAYTDYDLGPLKTGKEAEVFVVERVADDGRRCLLAHKRYRPRRVSAKGELAALGFQRAASFVHDAGYREGRVIGNSRDRRAVAKRSTHGRDVLGRGWVDHEFEALERLADAGVSVPYPVARTTDGILMAYLGDDEAAAPRLVAASLDRPSAERAADLLVADLGRMLSAGIVHADLSVYNVLWWEDRPWIIDVPQSVDVASHPAALELLRRDLGNVAPWFARQGVDFDADAVFIDLLAHLGP